MVKVEITSPGPVAGKSTKFLIDGKDVSDQCSGIVLDIQAGQVAKVTATFLVEELSVSVDAAEVDVTGLNAEYRSYVKADG